jgi:hypothetical protein
VAFAYTGLARIGQTPTDKWLVHTVASARKHNDLAAICEHIRATATEAFANLRLDGSLRRHAFQGLGWFRPRGISALRPGVVTIANALAQDGTWLASAEAAFSIRTLIPARIQPGFVLTMIGVDPSPAEKKAVWRLIRRCARQRAGTRAFLTAMILSVRWLSRRYAAIGPGLMAICLPRKAIEQTESTDNFLAMASGPVDSGCTFLNIPSSGSTPVSFGPNAVMGGSFVGDVKIEALQ